MIQRCPQCGAVLPSGVLAGHCPNCLVQTALDSDRATAVPEEPGSFPRSFGDYELLEEVARGGMGVVYRARQRSLKREVAVKMILAGEFASPEFVRRFRNEAAAAAGLQHPNIVAIHEVGEDNGRHYFSMDLVEGRNLDELVRDQALPARRAAAYVKSIAEAVHFAHEKGILHRDLKPSNILIDGFDQPRITDFGLAKEFRSETALTQSGQALGSPAYMPPEYAAGKHAVAGPASDLYSLGAILYHLLTGRPPFQGETLAQMLFQVQGAEPIAPRRLNPGVPEDVQTICLKCLEKDPQKRYPSAQGLADELERFLEGQPVKARPVGPAGKLWRWCLRNRALAGSLGALGLALLLGVVGVFWQWRRAEDLARSEHEQRERVERSELTTRLNLYAADTQAAWQAIERGDFGLGRRLLEAHRPGFGVPALISPSRDRGERGSEALSARLPTDLRGFEWRYLWQRCRGQQLATLSGHTWIVSSVAFSPDGRLLASASHDSTVRLWNLATRALQAALPTQTGPVWSVQFTPDGRLVTTGSDGKIKFWDADAKQVVATFEGRQAALSRSNSFMAVAEASPLFWEPAGKISLWDYRAEEKLHELTEPGNTLALSADDRTLAVAGPGNQVRLYDARSGKRTRTLESESQVWSLAFSPDGRQLAGAGRGRVLVWDLGNGAKPTRLHHTLTVWQTGFSPDGKILVSACSDRGLRLWDVATWVLKETLWGHGDEVWCAAFGLDGQTLATGSKDTTVMLWSATPNADVAPLPHCAWARPFFSPDGRCLVTVRQTNSARASVMWDVVKRVQMSALTNNPAVGFSPDGRHLIGLATDHAALEFWSLRSQGIEKKVPLEMEDGGWPFSHVGFSPKWDFGFGIAEDGLVTVFATETGKRLGSTRGPKSPIRAAAINATGTCVAVSTEQDDSAWLVEVAAGKATLLGGHRDFVSGLAFSPDGKLLATGSVDATIKLWDVARREELATLTGHVEEATDVVFSPDGRTLASVGVQHSVKFWHVATRRELMTVAFPRAGFHLQFSPDSRHLAVTLGADDNEAVQLLSAPLLEETGP